MTEETEADLRAAGETLLELAEGPGAAAARQLEEAFAQAGASIESSLSRAARSGQLDFEKMAEAILRDLARIAAQSVFGGPSGPAPAVNLNINPASGSDASSLLANRGAIQAALARAASLGGRYL